MNACKRIGTVFFTCVILNYCYKVGEANSEKFYVKRSSKAWSVLGNFSVKLKAEPSSEVGRFGDGRETWRIQKKTKQSEKYKIMC